jgi:hypothetical protein
MEKIDLEIQVPPCFPKEYYSALLCAAELCKKKTLKQAPQIEPVTRGVEMG